jgi:hypothetical protein
MRLSGLLRILPVAAVLLNSCSDITGPVSAPVARHALVDARTGGIAGFYFLPPIGPITVYPGDFDPDRVPSIEVCRLTSGGACGAVVASFATGNGSDGIRPSTEDEHFVAQWHSKDANATAGETYRVTVRGGTIMLGFADVGIVRRAADNKSLAADLVPLVAGATLPIKFRIEKSTLGPPVTATVGSDGGRVDVPIGNGSVFAMDIPAGALNGPVEFTITPRPNGSNALATVGISPSNPGFLKAVGLSISGAAATGSRASIAIKNGTDPATMFLPTANVSGVFTASTSQLGPPAPPVSFMRKQSLAASILAADEAGEAELALVLATVAEQIAAFRAAADALAERLRFEDAVWYRTQALVLGQLVDDPQVEATMIEGRAEACTAMIFHFSTAEGRLGDQFSNLWNALRPVIAWKASADIIGVESSECPQSDDFDGVVSGLIGQFTDLYTAATEREHLEANIPAMDQQLYDALVARIYRDLLAQETAFDRVKNEIQLPLARRYRKAAYDWCRTDNEQRYLGRLFRMARDAEMYAPGLPEVSDLRQGLMIPEDLGFSEESLSSDIQFCGTRLKVFTRDIDELSSLKGVVGGGAEPGSVASTLNVRVAPHGKILLDSILVALVCENEEPGNDKIHLRLNGVRVRDFSRLEPTVHFIRNGPRLVDVDSIADSAGVNLEEGGTFPLLIERDSDGCAGEYSATDDTGTRVLATLNLTYPDVDISLDPASISLQPGETRSIVATVSGSSTGVTWSVTGGTYTVAGNTLTYTAGSEAGSFSIKATSVEDTARSATVPVEIGGCIAAAVNLAMSCDDVSVSIDPSVATVRINTSKAFTAIISNVASSDVTWAATGGTISSTGVYTAGSVPGTYSVIGRSISSGNADTATVYVVDNFPIVLYRRNESYVHTEPQAAIAFGGFYTFNETSRMDTLQTSGTINVSAGGDVVTNANGSIRAMAQGAASLTTNLDVDSNLRIFGGTATGSLSATAMTEGTGSGSALADTWSVLILEFRVQAGTKLRLELNASTGGNCTTRGSATLDYLGSTPTRITLSQPSLDFHQELSLAQGTNRLTVLIRCFPNTYVSNTPPTNPGTNSGGASFNLSFAFKP